MTSNRSCLFRRWAGPLSALIAACGLSAHAGAQCNVYRLQIPDFDQKRAPAPPGIQGLPGNGSMYCVPTSATNWMAYLANHGYPAVMGGSQQWQSPAVYNLVTQRIGLMGLVMSTDADEGTTGSGHVNGIRGWVDDLAPGQFCISRSSANGSYAPQVLYHVMTCGGLINISLGRYQFLPPGTPPGFPGRWMRSGGHVMSLSRVYNGCSITDPQPTLYYRDPATGAPDEVTQSAFASQSSSMTRLTQLFASNPVAFPVARTVWMFDAATTNFSLLDAFTVIMPLFGITADAQEGQVSIVGGINIHNFTAPPPRTFNLPGGGAILGLAIDPVPSSAAVVAQAPTGQASLYRLQLGDGSFERLASLTSPGPMTFLPSGNLVIHDAGLLKLLDMRTTPATVLDTLPMSLPPSDIAYSDFSRRLYVVNATTQRIGATEPDQPEAAGFFESYAETPLPPWAQIAGTPSLAASSHDATVWLADTGDDSLVQLIPDAAGFTPGHRITGDIVSDPRDIAVDHRGHIYLSSNGAAAELAFERQAGEWVRVVTSPFAGARTGSAFAVAVGRESTDDWTNGPTDINFEPDEVFGEVIPDCDADLNADDLVNSSDFFLFLNFFFEGRADFNGDGATDSQDFFDYLAAFFRGC